MAEIRIEGPDGLDVRCPLTDEDVTIGSAEDCQVRIDSADVEPHHVTVAIRAVLRDLSGSQGVFFQGMQIPQHVFLPGDRVSLGATGAIQLSMDGKPQGSAGSNGEVAEFEKQLAQLQSRLEAVGDESRAAAAWQEIQGEFRARETALNAQLREAGLELEKLRAAQKDRGVSDRMLTAMQEESDAQEKLSRDRLAEMRTQLDEKDQTIAELREKLAAASEGELVAKSRELEAENARLVAGREEEAAVLRSRIDGLREQVEARDQELEFLQSSVESQEEELFALRTEFAGVRSGLLWPAVQEAQAMTSQDMERLLDVFVAFAKNIEGSGTKIHKSLHASQAELPEKLKTILAQAKEQGTTAARRALDQHLKMITGRWAHAWGLIFRQGYRNWADRFVKEMSPKNMHERINLSWMDKSLGGQEKKLWEAYMTWYEDITENVLVDQIDNEIKVVQGFFKL